jgi:hypothetical protein
MEAAHRGADHREHLAGHLRLVATVHGCAHSSAAPDDAVVHDVYAVRILLALVHVLGARVHLDLELLREHS